MSWELTGLVSRKKWGGQTRRLLALTMADKANDDGSGVYASVRTLARDSEISEATARRTIKEFLDAGIIVKIGERGCANGHTNIYSIQPETIEAMQDLKPAKRPDTTVTVRPVSRRKGSDADTPVTTTPAPPCAPTPVTVTDKPIQEPSSLTLTPFELENTPTEKPKAKKRKRKVTPYTIEFEAFWKSWPPGIRQNSDKRVAFERWEVALERWDVPTLARAAAHYLKNTKVNDTDPGPWKPRTCQAQVFLNGKLEAAVEAALEAPEPQQSLTHDEIELASARRYFDKTGKWPAGVPRPPEMRP